MTIREEGLIVKDQVLFCYPALTGSKTPTSKFSENKEVRRGSTARKSPIGSTNNQWGMPPTD
ncbi:hypothetical protein BAU22_22660 [Bacillus sp. 4048]|uniref:Uncharacterized protein n=1 Tax=Bacillus wiedmannii TaxID=1890302 RepID=A0AB73R7A2_9BACI|nr:hypothetical protein A6286_15655 [Bacillus wiedmannii]OJD42657.1 hypothetical protein BAU22_22660 [Bacillus sp. 4048]PEK17889.1 hypothetical protein CN694_27810 [Bacillus wiedmannii]